MSEFNMVQINNKLLELYDNRVLRSLIQLIPFGIGSAIDVAAKSVIEEYRAEKLKIFFDEIGTLKISLTEEVIKDKDFLHCYFATVNAVLKTRRKEKIEYLARLFGAVTNPETLKDIDEFESYLKSLEDLSYREIKILKLLYDFEQKHSMKHDHHVIARLKTTRNFWDDFVDSAVKEVGISHSEVNDILIMTERAVTFPPKPRP